MRNAAMIRQELKMTRKEKEIANRQFNETHPRALGFDAAGRRVKNLNDRELRLLEELNQAEENEDWNWYKEVA